jgi:hypothetical protein
MLPLPTAGSALINSLSRRSCDHLYRQWGEVNTCGKEVQKDHDDTRVEPSVGNER